MVNPELINRGQAPDHGIAICIALVKGEWKVMRMEEGFPSVTIATRKTFQDALLFLIANPLQALTSTPYEGAKTVTLVSPEGVKD